MTSASCCLRPDRTGTGALRFGKPMVLLPLFREQYDNARRTDEPGFGVRLDMYRFSDGEPTGPYGATARGRPSAGPDDRRK
ncbi:hypothetical protein [Streptomyces sp. CRN 30]|uniref:hypothetical protein n=1 Tax=Streptomyces sp. CRN 30 TaxID=3075613 RepID=UPI002A838D32|nr:hypothetical protein [Streptomyces sp. CRN 30]